MAYARKEIGRRGNYLLGGLVLAAAIGLGGYVVLSMRTGDALPDTGLCDRETAGLAVLLFDFTKPLRGEGPPGPMPGAILRESALALPAGTELRIYTLSGQPAGPLAEEGRLCKPSGAAQGDADRLDCAALSDRNADGSTFCARLDAMQRRVDEFADAVPELPVPRAHLIEAIEDVRLMFAGRPGTGHRSFHILSDMIQHAAWYSHVAPDGSLRLGPFDDLQARQHPIGDAPRHTYGFAAEVIYVPRRGWTEPTDRRKAHQRLWRQYFASAGMAVVFRDTAAMPRYPLAPPADRVTSLTPLLRQRELLRREQEQSERILTQVEAQSAELEQARRRAATDDSAAEALMEGLLAEEAEERRAIAAERTEIANIQAELATRRGGNDGREVP